MSLPVEPYVPASKSIPEATIQAVGLGLVLSFLMCAANIYVGLYAGMTVSAAIPASVISMGVLRGLLRRGTVLENNIVHTIASSGESLAAGIIFTVPALVLLRVWADFNYWETTLIAMAGGVMGVTMMIPLRRAMIIEQPELRFPEGVACAEVLKAGDRGGEDMLGIFTALGIGGLFKVLVSVFGFFSGSVEKAVRIGRTAIYGGIDISPMLMAVGFIVGFEVSLLVFLGGAISFLGAIPVLAWGADINGDTTAWVMAEIWDKKIRYFGIGAMVVAGIYSLIKVSGSIAAGLRSAIHGISGRDDQSLLPRTEQNITGRWLALLIAGCVVLTAGVYYAMTGHVITTVVTTAAMLVLAFFFVAVASYIAGLVGSSNSPVSGMTICTVLVTAGLLLVLGYTGAEGMLATLGVAGIVCCAACTSGDICQDLKIGHILGATPRRQQWAEVAGTIAPAFIIAPVMSLLLHAYGIGEPVREGVAPLKAPQAMMFKELVGTLFSDRPLPWSLVGAGAAVGIAAIVIDTFLLAPAGTKFRLHAMPLAVGMYLPWTVTTPILLGGIVYLLVEKGAERQGLPAESRRKMIHSGLLFSSGLVAGEAIMGIVIAVLMVFQLPLPLFPDWAPRGVLQIVSLGALVFMTWLLWRKATRIRQA
ncbi:MAG: oligopeptide transporter, OPT family [Acidobacteria bacterium]|nr:MAG: oligopeptide transporter, OPT family [Acidobacteriota bacterium]